MKNFISKTKQVLKTLDCYRYQLMATALLAIGTKPVLATTPTAKVVTLMGTVIDLFPAIGIVLALVGAFKLFMAFRNDQPDAYGGAAKDIVIGIVCIIFEAFIWTALTNAMVTTA